MARVYFRHTRYILYGVHSAVLAVVGGEEWRMVNGGLWCRAGIARSIRGTGNAETRYRGNPISVFYPWNALPLHSLMILPKCPLEFRYIRLEWTRKDALTTRVVGVTLRLSDADRAQSWQPPAYPWPNSFRVRKRGSMRNPKDSLASTDTSNGYVWNGHAPR